MTFIAPSNDIATGYKYKYPILHLNVKNKKTIQK